MKNEYSKILLKRAFLWDQIRQKIDNKTTETWRKADNSVVTSTDIFISELFEKIIQELFPRVNFFSEEKVNSELKFPLCILDPIDGTRSYAEGKDEWCVSFTIFNSPKISDPKNFSWIFNPISGYELDSTKVKKNNNLNISQTYISHSETDADWHKNKSFKIKAKGSIALKLALLAEGKSDFQITIKPKSIWDIAAGSHLCFLAGHRLYNGEKEIKELKEEKLYPPLIWAQPAKHKKISEYLSTNEKQNP